MLYPNYARYVNALYRRPRRLPEIPQAGVYALISRRTGAMYIGSATDMRRRRVEHMTRLSIGSHTYRVREEFGDHAPAEIEFKVLELVHTGKPNLAERDRLRRLLMVKERLWIRKLRRTHTLLNFHKPKLRTPKARAASVRPISRPMYPPSPFFAKAKRAREARERLSKSA